ncbi:leucine-rich_repeat domain-containing protein [Hexamita inflata]|uniref:Leucine-rich repeat domain-containing protein n=1 Tax=Hexamita inflata TaxID=28002 RepID=A0AA86RQ24_9EUKA|nr:leucine-rich repeat domain-containing protein [Hexamita inflata]
MFNQVHKVCMQWNHQNILVYEPFVNIRNLDISFNKGIDISQIYHLKDLISLKLNGNYLKDLSVLKTLTNLEELEIASNEGADITFLMCLTKLVKLDLSWNKLISIQVVSQLVNLKILNISYNNIIDISPLRTQILQLSELVIYNNKILVDQYMKQQICQRYYIRIGTQYMPTAAEINYSQIINTVQIQNIRLICLMQQRISFKKLVKSNNESVTTTKNRITNKLIYLTYQVVTLFNSIMDE